MLKNYWKEYYKEAANRNPLSPLKQTGKTVNGEEISQEQLGLIVSQIESCLCLSGDDKLVDLGCGNGELTVRLAPKVNFILGIDISEPLIHYANEFNSLKNISYHKANIEEIESIFFKESNCMMMYEVIQHLNTEDFTRLMERLVHAPGLNKFFIGGIPDKMRIHNFYDTMEKYQYYLSCEESNRPHLGRWWLETEIMEIATQFDWAATKIMQPESLYTAHYRFDIFLER